MRNKTFTITHEQRLDLLKVYNDLNSVLSYHLFQILNNYYKTDSVQEKLYFYWTNLFKNNFQLKILR